MDHGGESKGFSLAMGMSGASSISESEDFLGVGQHTHIRCRQSGYFFHDSVWSVWSLFHLGFLSFHGLYDVTSCRESGDVVTWWSDMRVE